jgi:MFS family permease
MQRNIWIFKIIFCLHQSWFWLGIWVLFYLRFTNYAGIGILESTMFFIGLLFEIPTGAIADLVGKKLTIILSFILYTLGELTMAFSITYTHLFISVLLLVLAVALFSGAAEAFLYDTLATLKKESEYDKVYSQIKSYGLLTIAASSVIGGIVYSYDVRLPFILTASAGLIGMFLLIFAKEPLVDTDKFSFKNYLKQNKQGFSQLFGKGINKNFLFILISISSLVFFLDEVLDYSLATELNIGEEKLGVLFAVFLVLAALFTYLYSKVLKENTIKIYVFLGAFLIIATMLVTPLLGVTSGIVFLASRRIFYPIVDIQSSNYINKNVSAKYRATTLSTYAMIYKLPYVLTAILVGIFTDKYGIENVLLLLGVIYSLILLPSFLINKMSK